MPRPKDPSIPTDGPVKTFVGQEFKEQIQAYCKRAELSEMQFIRDAVAAHYINCTADKTERPGVSATNGPEAPKESDGIPFLKGPDGGKIRVEGVCPKCGKPKFAGPEVLQGPKRNKPTYPPSYWHLCVDQAECGWKEPHVGQPPTAS